MKNIVIEIDGVRHIACKKGKGCESCSLDKYCPNEISCPCNDKIDHFKLEKSKLI